MSTNKTFLEFCKIDLSETTVEECQTCRTSKYAILDFYEGM